MTTTPHPGPWAVQVEGLHKRYGRTEAVRDVSLTVARGEIFGILGPNGSGKTTTVECLQGLRRPDGGSVRVLGLDPHTQTAVLRRRIGCQLQETQLPERLRVGEAIRLFAAVGGRRVEIDAVLDEWGLRDQRRSAFGSLSGGQRQRLFVALALLNQPELVFLDEMTTGLDPAARRETWQLVERVRGLGTTIVLVTHFMDEAARLCDRVAVLRDGAIIAGGTPAELVQRHGGGLTATFTGDLDTAAAEALPGVRAVRRRGPRWEVSGEAEALLHLGHLLVSRGQVPHDLAVRQATLEDAYFRLVGAESDAPAVPAPREAPARHRAPGAVP